VLVTGAAGLIGRVVTNTLLKYGSSVTGLVLDDRGDLGIDRVVVGDAADPETARRAMADIDAVVHLAALPTPRHGTPLEVFGGNTGATFTVLEEAGRAGVKRIACASSLSVLGLSWGRPGLHPAYLPIDEALPLQIEDPYALSKQADENTAVMMARRHNMAVVSLRFPFVANAERARRRYSEVVREPGVAAAELWTYLDVRDAAEACWLAITAPLAGQHSVFVAAPDILAPQPTMELIERYHPDCELRAPIPGRSTPIDLRVAQELLGFTAQYLFDPSVGASQ
jgi:nucleoside-diphosphate-sugar epimerase